MLIQVETEKSEAKRKFLSEKKKGLDLKDQNQKLNKKIQDLKKEL